MQGVDDRADFEEYRPAVTRLFGPVLNAQYSGRLYQNHPSMQLPDNFFGVRHGDRPEDSSMAYTARPLVPGVLPVPIMIPTGAPKLFH